MSERPNLNAADAVRAAKHSAQRTMQLLASHLTAMVKRRVIVSIVVCVDTGEDATEPGFANTVVISNVPSGIAAEVMQEYVQRYQEGPFEPTPKDH